MEKKKSALGKGLSSLLGPDIDEQSRRNTDILQVNVDFIKPCPFQPRKHFSQAELEELADSIKQNGVLQPIITRQTNENNYEIIAGERRWRACKLAGLRFIPVILKEASDKEALHYAILENIQRENLTPLEEAESYEKLRQEYNYTHESLANVLGKSRSYVSNILRLNNLEDHVKEKIRTHNITLGHARTLLGLPLKEQETLIEKIITGNLTVRQLEEHAKKQKTTQNRKSSPPKTSAYDDADTLAIQSYLSETLKSNVEISVTDGLPVLTIRCSSFEILDACVEKLSVLPSHKH
jgi:ParB family transcriptional regulator, chromosome partitioning protein